MHTRMLVAILLVLGLWGCGPPRPASSVTAAPADSAVIVPIDAAGLMSRVSDGRARATLVNVWASWCEPCREEFPAMLAVAKRHAPEGLRLVLVSADFEDELSPARQFLGEMGARDTSYVKRQADMEFIHGTHPAWGGALPATMVFDSRGRLLDFWEGGADSVRFERAVQLALQSKGDPS